MIKYLKRIYTDWETYRMIRNKLDVLDQIENQDLIRYLVNRYSEKDEEAICNIMMNELAKEMVKDNISPEKYRGYMMAISHRMMIFRNNRKLINKK